jgi:hypothetical protein
MPVIAPSTRILDAMIAWLSILVSLLPPLLMLLAVGTERLESTRLRAGTVREEDVKDFLDRVHRLRLTDGDHLGG